MIIDSVDGNFFFRHFTGKTCCNFMRHWSNCLCPCIGIFLNFFLQDIAHIEVIKALHIELVHFDIKLDWKVLTCAR